MSSFVQTSLESGVGRIRLHRPEKRNALTRTFIEQITAATIRLRDDDRLRVLILEAAGTVFCAGMDLGEMQERASSDDAEAEWQRDAEVYSEMLAAIFSLTVPTIAAVQGPVVAGGVGIVMACDMVVAAESAYFFLPEPLRGLTAAMVTPLLIHRVGYGTARYLLLSGERCQATEAKALTLCHDVVAADALTRRVKQLVAGVLSGSRAALRLTKEHIEQCTGVDVMQQLHESVAASARARKTDDAREGLAAFLEKRKPVWQPT